MPTIRFDHSVDHSARADHFDRMAQSVRALDVEPQRIAELLAPYVAVRRRRRIQRVIDQRLLSVTVVLERPHDPHNGAAVLRSCDALGLHHVHVVPASSSGFAVSRAVAQNADKWLDVYLHATIEGALGYLRDCGFVCCAAVPPQPGEEHAAPLLPTTRPLALVFGNEHSGLTSAALQLCDQTFHLPMYGFSESLNLSVSVALSLQLATAQRRAYLGRIGDLPAAAKQRLRAAYYARSVRHAVELVCQALNGRTGGAL